MSHEFSRKVQLTREEFLRQLPDAAGAMSHHMDGDQIVIEQDEKRIRINLVDLGIEELGSLDLPMQQVNFSFENMGTADIETFMTRWDEHKLRMGG